MYTPEEDKSISDTSLPMSAVDVAVEADTNSTTKLPVNASAEKPQQPQAVLEATSSSTKLVENGEKRTLPSPETTAPISLLPTSATSQSNSPSHRIVKEQSLHSRDSSSDLSQAGDSQVSMTKEPVSDISVTGAGEIKKQKSRDYEKEVNNEQPELPTITRDTSQQESSSKSTSDVTGRAPSQSQQQPPPQQPSSSQQKKSRTKVNKEKRPLKLTIVGREQDLVECNLTNGGQTITFKFSLDGDSSEQIAQGMVGCVNGSITMTIL